MAALKSLLVANRSEIAIRVMRAAAELGIRTVSIYSNEDRFALHRFKADESYRVDEGKKPLPAYLDIEDIIRIARQAKLARRLVQRDESPACVRARQENGGGSAVVESLKFAKRISPNSART
jgi:hypothetical protein